jgi:hypothetical protein
MDPFSLKADTWWQKFLLRRGVRNFREAHLLLGGLYLAELQGHKYTLEFRTAINTLGILGSVVLTGIWAEAADYDELPWADNKSGSAVRSDIEECFKVTSGSLFRGLNEYLTHIGVCGQNYVPLAALSVFRDEHHFERKAAMDALRKQVPPLFWAKDHLQDLYVRLNELYPSRLSSAEVARLRSRTETVVSKAIHTFISESESRLKKNKGQGSF